MTKFMAAIIHTGIRMAIHRNKTLPADFATPKELKPLLASSLVPLPDT
jgi:hypothetical protein